ncbi:hypothetical protein JOC78_003482 [Bacillus ectoiniformans]|uniref:YaaC family protein n=1 Tax=Bacillus ectoiniformans TaxID=1494429 RepID=UPI00195DFF4B|nr:YaaC family protein [Bacillus ectoiniformans]MBM7650490.1 hypothetical protein [Bacillus ectoiniformans]
MIYLHQDPLLPYKSAFTTKKLLFAYYQAASIEKPEEKAFNNCDRFIHFLEHGGVYLDQARQAPLAIQPTLAFYGLTHLIKACLLLNDPDYPTSSQVLAHGLSTRKKKKQGYRFLQDEVRTQRNGLFPHISDKLFHVKQLEGTKFNMKNLLMQIPELNELLRFHFQHSAFITLIKKESDTYLLSKDIIDDYKMTDNRFTDYLSEKTKGSIEMMNHSAESFTMNCTNGRFVPPFRYNCLENQWTVSRHKTDEAFYPELLIHFALLYNLSMIARYETEWWYEMLKLTPNEEYSFIKHFIDISIFKCPVLIDQYLKSRC